jgi:tRNA(Ile)-lysidine synthase
VAYSGGLDSEVLLHALSALRGHLAAQIRAIHVDHGLQPQSPSWVLHCQRTCARLGVGLSVRRLELNPIRGESLEALARAARYGILASMLGEGDLLLTGQHRDDQAETLLLALLRGSGVKGLSAMPQSAPLGRGCLVRPLLAFGRADLLVYARAAGLTWVEDPSNAETDFDRNFVRQRLVPILRERWPACDATLARAARHCAEAQRLIDVLAGRTLCAVQGQPGGSISVSRLRALERPLAKAVVRHWISGLALPLPDTRRLARLLDEVAGARPDATPLVAWKGCEVRRYRDALFAMPPLPDRPQSEPLAWFWGVLELPPGLGWLLLRDWTGRLLDPVVLSPAGLSVRFGVRGLKCRPGVAGRHRSLKKLFQEAAVPPWLRAYVPLVFHRGALVAVADQWVCFDGAAPEKRAELRVAWRGGIRGRYGFTTR